MVDAAMWTRVYVTLLIIVSGLVSKLTVNQNLAAEHDQINRGTVVWRNFAAVVNLMGIYSR